MDLNRLEQDSDYCWRIPAEPPMRLPGILYGDREKILPMDDKV